MQSAYARSSVYDLQNRAVSEENWNQRLLSIRPSERSYKLVLRTVLAGYSHEGC